MRVPKRDAFSAPLKMSCWVALPVTCLQRCYLLRRIMAPGDESRALAILGIIALFCQADALLKDCYTRRDMSRARPALVKRLREQLSDPARGALDAALTLAKSRGTPLFLVGGAVRDLLLRSRLADVDLVVVQDIAVH